MGHHEDQVLQGESAAQAAASSSAVAANHGEYYADFDWRAFVRYRNRPLKDLFPDFKKALLDGKHELAKLLFYSMNIHNRSAEEAAEIVYSVKPQLRSLEFTPRFLNWVIQDLDNLGFQVKNDKESRDLVEVLINDTNYLINSLNAGSFVEAVVFNELDSVKLAREIRKAENFLKARDLISMQSSSDLIKGLKDSVDNDLLRSLAEDVLARIEKSIGK